MSRTRDFIRARDAAANRDVVANQVVVDHMYNTPEQVEKGADTNYRITVDNPYPQTVIVRHSMRIDKKNKRKRDNDTVQSKDSNNSEELIDTTNNDAKTSDLGDSDTLDDFTVSIDYISDRLEKSNHTDKTTMDNISVSTDNNNIEPTDTVDQAVTAEIDFFLIGLENRYTDQTPYRLWNRMYTVGLDIAISSYSKKKAKKIIDRAIRESITELGETLDEIRVYSKKKVIEYIQCGIQDGMSSDYSDIYFKIINNKPLTDLNQSTDVSSHLGSMFSKYADSAHPHDIEQFYNVGVMIANRPFDRDRMIDKLNHLIFERSKDKVVAIQRNKRSQLLDSMNRGFQDSLNEKIRNAYDLNGKYNYDNRDRLRKRARIDALLQRKK